MNNIPPPPPMPIVSPSAGMNSPGEQGTNIPANWTPTIAKPVPVVRCTYIKNDGDQCTKWSIRGATVCVKHGGSLPNVKKHAQEVVMAAKVRLMNMAPDAMDVLYDLLQPGTGEGIRLKAATEVLDRAGLKAGMEIAVTVENKNSPLEEINKRLAIMAERFDESEVDEDVEDAEIVEGVDDVE